MNKKKICIIGESDIVFIKEYVENMLKYDPSIQFTIVTYTKKRYLDFYKSKKVRLIQIGFTACNEYPFELNEVDNIIVKLLYDKFDFVHVHAVTYRALKLATMIAGKRSKLVISYWSYITRQIEIKRIEPLLKEVYKISFVTEGVKEDFQKYYGHEYNNECFVVDFGNNCIRNMAKMLNDKSSRELKVIAKDAMNFPADRIVIAIGYCGRKDQQHIKVLKAIEKLPQEILSRLYLFLHVSYSVTEPAYIVQLEKKLKAFERYYGCQYNVSKEYMTGERLAYLRFGVDMFINAEIMDALSSSMLEYMFGGALVLNPKRLEYLELKKNAIKDIKYDRLEDLPLEIEKIVDRLEIIKSNRKPIWNMCAWKNLLAKWHVLYE